MANTIGTLRTVLTADTRGLTAGTTKAQASVNALRGTVNMLGKAIAAFGILATATFAAFAVSSIKIGAEFERTMAVVKGVTRATGEEFNKLNAIAREMGATTEWTANQAAEALKFLGMAGFTAAKAIAALPGTLQIATAGNIDLGRAADITTNALTAMQMAVEEMGRVGDVFIGTITRSNTDMNMMAESFKYAAPVAKAFGYEIEGLASMIGVLGNAGVQGSMAGTQLAFAIQKSAKIAKEFNMEGSGFIDVLKEMKARGWEAAEIMKAFGMRGGRAALILKDLIPEVEKLEESLKNSGGEAAALAKTMNETVIGSWRNMKSALEGLKLDWFEKNQESIKKFLDTLTEVFREMAKTDRWKNFLDISSETFTKIQTKIKEAFDSGAIGRFIELTVASVKIFTEAWLSGINVIKIAINGLKKIWKAAGRIKIHLMEEKAHDDIARYSDEIQAMAPVVKEINKAKLNLITPQAINRTMRQSEAFKKFAEEYAKIEGVEVDTLSAAELLKIYEKIKVELAAERKLVEDLTLEWEENAAAAGDLGLAQLELTRKFKAYGVEIKKIYAGVGEKNEREKEAVDITKSLHANLVNYEDILKRVAAQTARNTASLARFNEQARIAEKLSREATKLDYSTRNLIPSDNGATAAEAQRQQTSEGILNSIQGVTEPAGDITEVYETAASSIRDSFVNAFIEIAKTGKMSFEGLGNMFISVGAAMITQAWIVSASMQAALIASGWGAALVAFGVLLSQLQGDDGPSKRSELKDALEELTDTIKDWSVDLKRDVFETFGNVSGQWGMALYDLGTRMDDIMGDWQSAYKDFAKLGQTGKNVSLTEDIFGAGFVDWMKDQWENIAGYSRGGTELYDDILQPALDALNNFADEVRIIAFEIRGVMDEFAEAFNIPGFLKTNFQSRMDDFTDAVGELSAGAAETLSLYFTEVLDPLNSLYSQLGALERTTVTDLIGERPAEFQGTNWEGVSNSPYWRRQGSGGDWVFDWSTWNTAVENAEEEIADGIAIVTAAIDDLELKLLSPEEIERITGQWGAEVTAYYTALIEDFIRIRREVFDEAGNMVGTLTGEISDLDNAVLGVTNQFEAWHEALIDAGASIEEQLVLFTLWEKAIKKTMAKPFETLQEEIQAWREDREREDWGITEWMSHFNTITESLKDLNPEGDDYFDDSLELLTKQWDTLKEIESAAREQITQLTGTSDAIESLVEDLKGGGDIAGGTSAEYWNDRYSTLFNAAMAPGATSEDVSTFESFIPDFMDFMESYTPHYAGVVESVLEDLGFVQTHIKDLVDGIEASIPDMTDVPGVDDAGLGDIYDVLAVDILTRLGDIVTEIGNIELDMPDATAPPTSSGVEPTISVPSGSAGIAMPSMFLDVMSAGGLAGYIPNLVPVPDQAGWNDWVTAMGELYEELTPEQIAGDIAQTVKDGGLGKTYPEVDGIPHGYLINWDGESLNGIRYYKEGGWTGNSPGMIDPEEWVVPTRKPEAGRFLKDVGADPELIAEYVAAKISESTSVSGSGNGDIVVPVTVEIDGEVLARVTARQIRKGNSDLINNMRRYING